MAGQPQMKEHSSTHIQGTEEGEMKKLKVVTLFLFAFIMFFFNIPNILVCGYELSRNQGSG